MCLLSTFTINTGSFRTQLILTLSSKQFTLEFVDQVKVNITKMKCVLLVVLLAAAASAAVFGNEVPDVAELPAGPDVDLNETPEVFVTDVEELTAAADLSDGAEDTAVSSRWSLIQGTIGSSDVRVYNGEHRANGVAGHVTTRDITIRTSRRITAIRVIRLGTSQNAMPSIVSGGVGTSAVTIRIRSAVGRGFHYSVQVYGR